MSRGISKRTKKLTLGAMLAAIGAVLLLLGSLFQVIVLSMAAIASFVCVIAVIELGTGWAWMIYGVVGVISVLLRPTSFAPWVYVAFLGYYPIIKEKIERETNKNFDMHSSNFYCWYDTKFRIYASG